ncbi:MAG TPA: replicative DNA helicase [Longimicrobium sp.]|nr:replicative DNA helicase [Longimicrobium sp.]
MVAPQGLLPESDTNRRRRTAYSAESEMAVLGGCMIDPAALDTAAAVLPDPAMFHREAHRRLYAAFLRISGRGEALDEITVTEDLRAAGDYEAVGGLTFLAGLLDAVPTAANIEYHCRIVRDNHTLRKLAEAGQFIGELGSTPTRDVAAVLDQAEASLAAVTSQTRSLQRPSRIKEILWPVFEEIQHVQESGAMSGLPSGFDAIDEVTGGYQRQDLVIIAARPSMGKSSWIKQAAIHLAVQHQKPGAYFSLEESRSRVVRGMICNDALVNSRKMKRGTLDDDDYARMAITAGRLNTAPIYIDDTPGLSLAHLRLKARELARDVPDLGWIVVDYLQLMAGGKRSENRQQEVTEISRGLKNLARELDLPVFALSQLSRAVESRPDKRPVMSDLRESGSLEQDADVIMFLYRPEYYYGPADKDGNSLEGIVEIIFGKQRDGAAGRGSDASVRLRFLKEFTRFEPW